ncbi:MAG: hypothetical protein D6688_07545 [Alphaproteobacteria bacterium]|nr:MAG: hypothetical protein D6688_07545 [Alphaproteobacteria bacterium]
MTETPEAEIAELERRIRSALDRIGAAVEALPAGGAAGVAAGEEVEALREQLADAEALNRRLTERLEGIGARHQTLVTRLEKRIEALAADRDVLAEEVESLRAERDALAEDLRRLEQERRSEIEEMNRILGELEPLVKEVGNA